MYVDNGNRCYLHRCTHYILRMSFNVCLLTYGNTQLSEAWRSLMVLLTWYWQPWRLAKQWNIVGLVFGYCMLSRKNVIIWKLSPSAMDFTGKLNPLYMQRWSSASFLHITTLPYFCDTVAGSPFLSSRGAIDSRPLIPHFPISCLTVSRSSEKYKHLKFPHHCFVRCVT